MTHFGHFVRGPCAPGHFFCQAHTVGGGLQYSTGKTTYTYLPIFGDFPRTALASSPTPLTWPPGRTAFARNVVLPRSLYGGASPLLCQFWWDLRSTLCIQVIRQDCRGGFKPTREKLGNLQKCWIYAM